MLDISPLAIERLEPFYHIPSKNWQVSGSQCRYSASYTTMQPEKSHNIVNVPSNLS